MPSPLRNVLVIDVRRNDYNDRGRGSNRIPETFVDVVGADADADVHERTEEKVDQVCW